ncbi:MAG: hypothetical protein ABIR67_03325 [Gaiellaceae bacterium]
MVFCVTGVAYAQSPATVQYSKPKIVVESAVDDVSEVGAAGTLPFTGVSLALIVAAGLLLIAVGLFARRRGAGASA